jgi:hypothetical protein
MRSWQSHQRQFWRSLPLQGYITFVLAVAATFSTMGFLVDQASADRRLSGAAAPTNASWPYFV